MTKLGGWDKKYTHSGMNNRAVYRT